MPDDLPTDLTDLGPLTDLPPQGALVEEPSAAELDRIAPNLGTGGDQPPPLVASAPRTAPELATYISRAYDARPPFADVATPPEVLAADEAMQAAIAADQEARAAFAELPGREAAEQAEVGRLAVAGENVPPLTDWNRERLIALAKHAELAKRTKAAITAYQDAITAALPAWRARLLEAMDTAHTEAREAWVGSELHAKVARWRAAQAAVTQVDALVYPNKPLTMSPVPSDVKPLVGEGQRAADTLDAYLRTDHPAVTKSYLRRKPDEPDPPMWVREALNETATGASRLHAIEVAEGWRYSRFTEDMANRSGRGPDDRHNAEPWNNSASAI
jgi:hypothetical protein